MEDNEFLKKCTAAGLNAQQVEAITTPVKQLSKEGAAIAFNASDKLAEHSYATKRAARNA